MTNDGGGPAAMLNLLLQTVVRLTGRRLWESPFEQRRELIALDPTGGLGFRVKLDMDGTISKTTRNNKSAPSLLAGETQDISEHIRDCACRVKAPQISIVFLRCSQLVLG